MNKSTDWNFSGYFVVGELGIDQYPSGMLLFLARLS